MADIAGVHHINVSVSDLARSTRWYGDLFGLTELARVDDDAGAWSKVILRHDSGLLIGLTEHAHNQSQPFSEFLCGFDHVALLVGNDDQLTQWQVRLQQFSINASPLKSTPLGKLITIRDPDNVQLELYSPRP